MESNFADLTQTSLQMIIRLRCKPIQSKTYPSKTSKLQC